MGIWEETIERIQSQEKKMGPSGKGAIEFECNNEQCQHNWVGIFKANERVNEHADRIELIVKREDHKIAFTYLCPACLTRSVKVLKRSRVTEDESAITREQAQEARSKVEHLAKK